MRKNIFTAALESQSEQPIDVAKIIQETQQDFQPKPGFKEDGDEPSADKVTKAIGDDSAPSVAEHDEIDTVAESQDHVLALEHLQKASQRYCRMAAALEEIAEVAEQNLEEGQSMDPTQVAMVTTAIDAGGIGEPMADSVALEAFGMDARVATESFIDAVRDRAAKIWTAVKKFLRKAAEITHEKLKRFADFFRSVSSTITKLEKDFPILEKHGVKPFQNAKWEKELQEGIHAPSTTKTIPAAIAAAASEVDQVSKIVNGKLVSDLAGMKAAWRSEKAETVVAQMNKVLSNLRLLDGTGVNKFKHAAYAVEVNLPERVTLEGTGGLDNLQLSYEQGSGDFSAGLKTASVAEIKALKQFAEKATNVLQAAWGNYYEDSWSDGQDQEMKAFFEYYARGEFNEEKKDVARKLATKYVNLLRLTSELCNAATFATADGLHGNIFMAIRWARFSVAEAKAAAREEK